MRDLSKAMGNLENCRGQLSQSPIISFHEFLQEVIDNPQRVIRNVYQVYTDMADSLVCDGIDEYGDDPESIGFLKYDCSQTFCQRCRQGFFCRPAFCQSFDAPCRQFQSGRQAEQDIHL